MKIYDVGRLKPATPYAERHPEQAASDGEHVPTLAEVFALAERAGDAEVRFNIETKLEPAEPDLAPAPEIFAAALLSVIAVHGMADRVTIQSFDWRTLREVQRRAPGMPTAYLTAQQEWLDNVRVGQAGPSPWTAGPMSTTSAAACPGWSRRPVAASGRHIVRTFPPARSKRRMNSASR